MEQGFFCYYTSEKQIKPTSTHFFPMILRSPEEFKSILSVFECTSTFAVNFGYVEWKTAHL